MKLILTHKRQLKHRQDVTRFLSYCYGKSLARPVVPVEGFFPGLPSGDAKLDAKLLLSMHHGGKASKARSVAFSSEYFSSREEAVANALALPRVMSGFREAWAPHSQALSIVHMTEGTGNWCGHWRLDGHLIMANSTGKAGIQWSRKQCQEMQNFEWLSPKVLENYGIESGKGKGVTKRVGSLPYPKAKLVAYEVGCLTDYELETYIKSGTYGAARRAKTGRIISVEVAGKRINIQRARQLVSVRDTSPGIGGILPELPSHALVRNGGVARPRVAKQWNRSLHARRAVIRLGNSENGRRSPIWPDHLLFQRRRGLSANNTSGIGGASPSHYPSILIGPSVAFPMAIGSKARARLNVLASNAGNVADKISELESVRIFK